jgi:hypothetical protein
VKVEYKYSRALILVNLSYSLKQVQVKIIGRFYLLKLNIFYGK